MYGITVYPPTTHPNTWRSMGPYKHGTLRGCRLAARAASLFGLWVLGAHDVTEHQAAPKWWDRYVAVETEDWDLDRYRMGRRVVKAEVPT